MENFGWFGSIKSCIVLPCTSKFSTDFALLLSFTSVLSWFQGMGGKSYLLGLLGLLLISCKCTLAFFCRRKSWVLQVFQFAQFPRIIYMLTKNFISFQCTWKQIVLRQICREGFGRFVLKVSFRVFGLCNYKIRYVYIVKSRSIAFRFHHSVVSIGNCPLATYLLATI